MQTYVQLAKTEVLGERPFTNPVNSGLDLSVLQHMVTRLGAVLQQLQASGELQPTLLHSPEVDGRYHRLTFVRPEALLTCDPIHVVGFCGQRREKPVNGPILDKIDDTLITEFPNHPHLLTYSTMVLPCGNSANMVLFDAMDGIIQWAHGRTHARAVELSPGFYRSIRLHNAILHGGLYSGRKLELKRTKYFDYRDPKLWIGMREM